MFNFVRLSDGGAPRHQGPRAEIDILGTMGRMIGAGAGAVDWESMRDPCKVRQLIAQVVPGFEKLGDIDRTREEFQIPGRTFHTPRFATPSEKARFAAHPLLSRREGELRLMTVRSEGQFNTVVYEEEDLYRGQERRDVILLNSADMDRLGLRRDQRVTVRSSAGEMRHVLVRPYDIRAGNALMYYPEANVLVPITTDPESKTPAFKSVAITIESEERHGLHPLPTLSQND
jgi:anaerobic selenocysteine-containing dehydrogenase